METILDLIDKRASVHADMRSLVTKTEGESRDFNDDENVQYERMQSEFDTLNSRIQRLEAQEAREAQSAKEYKVKGEHKSDTLTYRDAFTSYMRKGEGGLSPEERNVLQTRGTATQIAATDSLGGYLVNDELIKDVITSLKYYGGMPEVCKIYETSTGGAMPFPTFNGTATDGSVVAENASVAVSDMTFGQKVLNAWEINSGIAKASRILVNDAFFNAESFINDELLLRIARAYNALLTNGTGSSQPTGITNGLTPTDLAAITRGALIDLKTSINRAYHPNARFMMNSATAGAIMKLSIGSGDDRPLWQNSMQVGAPAVLEGLPVVINDELPNFATSGDNAILCGDFSKYVSRKAGGLTVLRSEERYFEERAIGFQAFIRADGDLMDTAAVKSIGGNG